MRLTPTRRSLAGAAAAVVVAALGTPAASAEPVVVAGEVPPGFECLVLPGGVGQVPGTINTDQPACPGPVPKGCNRELAAQSTAEGYRCRDHLFTTGCEGKPPAADIEAWCRATRDRRWGACSTIGARASDFEGWCASEEERRQQLGESTSAPGSAPGVEPRAPTPVEDPNRPGFEGSDAPPLDATKALGGDPMCDRSDLTAEVLLACKASGSVQHKYPFSNYGIDNNVEVDVFNSDFWTGDAPFKSAIQWVCVQIWQLLIWLIKMVLLLMEWAFARDPLGIAIGQLKESLVHIHESVLGTEWTLAALAIAGLWGIWNGLVRMRIIQTIGGLAATVLLMIGALWIIYDPDSTVGFMNRTANEASLAVVSAASSGSFDRPGGRFAERQHGLFQQVVEKPWCALQFASVDYCLADRNEDGLRNIDVWLTFAPGGPERAALYTATKGEEVADPRGTMAQLFDWVQMRSPIPSVREEAEQRRHKDTAPQRAVKFVEPNPSGVRIQGKDGTFTRLGLLAILAFGMIGAISLFLWLGLRLIGAAVISLLLLVLAPLMMLVAAFGEEGRARFGQWLKALIGAVIAKLVYGLILALVLLVSGILADLPLDTVGTLVIPEPAFAQTPDATGSGSGNFLGSWLLQSAFWWAVLVRRDRILGFIAFDPAGERDGIGALSRFHFGYQAVTGLTRDARRAVTWAPRKALRLGGKATRMSRRNLSANRMATDQAIAGTADSALDQHADRAIRGEREDDLADATRIMERGKGLEGWLHNVKQDIRKTKDPALADALRADKERLEEELLRHRHDPKTRWASSVAGRDAGGVRPSSAAAKGAWRDRRREDIAEWDANSDTWDSRRNRHAAGISDTEWRRVQASGDGAQLAALRAKSEQALQRDRDLFARAPGKPLDRHTRASAAKEYRADPDFALRTADARRSAREEARDAARGRPHRWGR